jgi:hypothetical protein
VSTACKDVLYTFTNNILSTNQNLENTVNLTWDTSSQPNAAFEYTLNWQALPVQTGDKVSGWPLDIRPSVAWLNQDGTEATGLSTNPAYVRGLACLSNTLPKPYGTLGAGVGTTGIVIGSPDTVTVTGIAANPSVNNPLTGTPYTQPARGAPAIPTAPFPIVIANSVGGVQDTATERMRVESIASQTPSTVDPNYTGTYTITFNVTRGAGMTTPATHDTGYQVVSTPLPLIPTDDSTNFPLLSSGGVYKPGTQAHMCIASHGFTAFDFLGGTANVLYSTHVFDIGDGWVTIPK